MVASTEACGPTGPICLIVDGEAGARQSLSEALRRLDVGAREHHRVSAMLSGVPEGSSGVVFLDLAFEDSDAVEALKGLQGRRFRGAVQLMSGRGLGLMNEVRRIGERLGLRMLPPLQKPFRSAAVEKIVREEGLLAPGRASVEEPNACLASALADIEDVLAGASSEQRREALRVVSDLFVENAQAYRQATVEALDRVFLGLLASIETAACAELAERLAHVPNAPLETIRRLAMDDEAAVFGPVLRHSPRLDDADLRGIAESKGQAHLLAISARKTLGAAVTDVLVRRGDRDVLRAVAANSGACFSAHGYVELIDRSAGDEVLQERIGRRRDLPPSLLDRLVGQATEAVRRRLSDLLGAGHAEALEGALTAAAARAGHAPDLVVRDYGTAQRQVAELEGFALLDEVALADFAAAHRFEETVLALSRLCALPLATVESLMGGPRLEPLLVLCRASAFAHSTMAAVARCSAAGRLLSRRQLEAHIDTAERFGILTAQRVIRFWRVRESAQPSDA